jgi:thiosulfate/3-mercaptopyruvate sulfurtransferase
MFASRLWWLLRWVGHSASAVLDGGFDKWTAEKRATRGGTERRRRTEFKAERQPHMMVDATAVNELTGRSDWRLVDARAPERYRGEVEPLDKKAGHIPTAVNHFFQTNMNAQGTFKTPEELRAHFAPTLGRVPPDQIVCYCGSGVTACHNLLAMEHAGLKGAKLYAGSWSEWSADESRPIAVGAGG